MRPYKPFHPSVTVILLSILSVVSAFSQTEEKLKSLFVEAESYFLFEEYKDALPLYQRLNVSEPDNYNVNFKIGLCYLNDIYQYPKSLSYLEKASSGIKKDAKVNSFKEKNAPPEALYYLGNAYRMNNRLSDAIKAYQEFKLILDPDIYDAALVDEQIAACKIALDQQKTPMYFIADNVGEGINDRFEELNPVVSGDEKVIAFTRKLQFYDAVFCSRKVNGKWSEPVNLTQSFGVDGNTYTTGISYNGDELYVYRSDNFDGNIYVSKYKNGIWSKLEKLNGNINTKFWESHASISKDGKTLYFTSNRDGGYGGLDIYRSERKRGGDWGPAVNLGPVINSRFNEDTPFFTEDGKTLYFSSMGHYNMGGYDIFYSRLDNGQWTKPENIGYPLNTTRDDLFLVPVSDGAFAYYAKYDTDNTFGMMDIYKLEVFTELHPRKFILNGNVRVDGSNPAYSKYTATLINRKTGKVFDQTHLNEDGTYSLNAQSGEFDLQIKGAEIGTSTERVYIPVNNPSNLIQHSSVIAAKANGNLIEETSELPKTVSARGPEMEIENYSYTVTANESIPIRLDLEKDTHLKVVSMLDGIVKKTEHFDIKRRKFVYMLTPEPGTNTLRFTLFNSTGDSTVREVSIVYNEQPTEPAVIPPTNKTVLSERDQYKGIASQSDGSLKAFLNETDLSQFNSIADLYDYLLKNAPNKGYTAKEVDAVMSRFLSQKDLNLFYEELSLHASDSLSRMMNQLKLDSLGVYTAESLVDHLYQKDILSDDLRNALYEVASLYRDPVELIDLFKSYAQGELKGYLQKLSGMGGQFPDTKSVADNILEAASRNEFSIEQLNSMLKMAAIDINMHFLSQSLLFISSDPLRQTLLDLNPEKASVGNSQELITLLLSSAEKQKYSKRDLLLNIEKIRRDPYYFVDMFRRLLAEKATGSLKEFLQEIDIRNLKINTYEQFIDYLLSQSQFHDYNREMVYQLLIDIINPKSVEEFVQLLRLYASEGIVHALDASDPAQFSKPLEVVQYLLSVAEDYHFTERELLRVLLKMLLKKGPTGTGDDSEGWFSHLDRPVLVSAVIAVNAIIIILLILFWFRKKRKNV